MMSTTGNIFLAHSRKVLVKKACSMVAGACGPNWVWSLVGSRQAGGSVSTLDSCRNDYVNRSFMQEAIEDSLNTISRSFFKTKNRNRSCFLDRRKKENCYLFEVLKIKSFICYLVKRDIPTKKVVRL
jgi:hypothetical protein